MRDMKELIEEVCDDIKAMLIEKNESYGNSAAEPICLFSQINNVEQLNVRIDDKLSRIKCGGTYGNEDTEMDLAGYLLLRKAVSMFNKEMIG